MEIGTEQNKTKIKEKYQKGLIIHASSYIKHQKFHL